MTEEDKLDPARDDLMGRVREAVRLRVRARDMRLGEGQEPPNTRERSRSTTLPPFIAAAAPRGGGEPIEEIAAKPEYTLAEFTCFQDEAFVRNAYRGILRRDPDPTGSEVYTAALRSARLTKPEILGHLRYSAEGRGAGVRVRGLLLVFAWRKASRVPVVGRVLRIAEYFLRLPDTAASVQRLESEIFRLRSEALRGTSALAERLDRAYALHEARVDEVAVTVQSRIGELADTLQARVDTVAADVRRDFERTRREMEVRVGLRPTIPDTAYAAFELAFRGTREEIKTRVAVYLPDVGEACRVTGAPVLDVGCGRGEWLELLREHGIAGRGVDLNAAMIECCLAAGLDVGLDDGLAYLRSLDDHSLGAVTAFHIVEHLPFATLLALLQEVARVLRPGGIAIFESPNPENLIVGACNFYFDPTHLSPIPPPMLEFFVQQAGFSAVTILRLHPSEVPESFTVGDPFLRNWLFGPQDYAVIGRKPAPAGTAGGAAQPG